MNERASNPEVGLIAATRAMGGLGPRYYWQTD
jgi:hypothetical protein